MSARANIDIQLSAKKRYYRRVIRLSHSPAVPVKSNYARYKGNMDEMIFALLRLTENAERRLLKLDARLERTAEYAFGDTWSQIESMLDIIEEKRRLQSALELRENLVKGLTEEEYVLLNARAHGAVPRLKGNGRGYSDRSLRRKTLEAVKTAENILFLLGVDCAVLGKRYGKILEGDAA